MIIRRPEDVAAAVKKARRDLSLSQSDLATRVEVDRQWVYRLENGEPGVSFGLVLRALNVLGLKLEISTLEEKDPIASIPRDIERAFSKRRQAIEAAAAAYGYRSPKGMEQAALRTRQAKRNVRRDAYRQSPRFYYCGVMVMVSVS